MSEQVTNRDEPFMDLSLDVEQNSSVTACLRNFSSTETLTKKNKFFCESCNALQVISAHVAEYWYGRREPFSPFCCMLQLMLFW